jgi:prepilin-type N-terminal cleavage/methylation domain-containing protein
MDKVFRKQLVRRSRHGGGFTLVEVIVVIVIIAILAAIGVPALTGYIDKARQRQAIGEAHDVQAALQTMGIEIMANGGNLVELSESTWDGSTHLEEGPWTAYPRTGVYPRDVVHGVDVGDVVDTLTGSSSLWNGEEGTLDNIRIISFSTSGQLTHFYFKSGAYWVEWTPAGGYKVLTPQEVEETGDNLFA